MAPTTKTSKLPRKKTNIHKFYLLRPKENANIDVLADQLISLKNVREVFVTDGDYGFIVKTRFSEGKEPKNVTRYITKHIGQDYGKVVSYYRYKK